MQVTTYTKAIKVTVDGPREPRTKSPGHPSPFGPFSLLQAPWLDPAYLNLAQLTSFGQFGTSLGNITVLPNGGPKPWDHSAMRRDPLALIKGVNSALSERGELGWPSSPAGLATVAHGLVPGGAYPPGPLGSYPPPPPPPPAPHTAPLGTNNFNLQLSINPARLLGPTHLHHPLTSLINSLRNGATSGSNGSSSLPPGPAPKSERASPPEKPISQSAFRHVTPTSNEDSQSTGAGSPPAVVAPAAVAAPVAAPVSSVSSLPAATTAAVSTNHSTKSVWRPY